MAEYERDVITVDAGVEVPVDELTAYHERQRRAVEAARKAHAERLAALYPNKYCPVNVDGGNIRECRTDCAFYHDGGCGAANHPAHNTAGKRCPMMGIICSERCMAYRDGCTLS